MAAWADPRPCWSLSDGSSKAGAGGASTGAPAVAPFVVFAFVAWLAGPFASDFFLDDDFFGGIVVIGLWFLCVVNCVDCQNSKSVGEL